MSFCSPGMCWLYRHACFVSTTLARCLAIMLCERWDAGSKDDLRSHPTTDELSLRQRMQDSGVVVWRLRMTEMAAARNSFVLSVRWERRERVKRWRHASPAHVYPPMPCSDASDQQ
eukprot:9547665-Ditylum_brightwellii.AAC.1